MLRQHEGRILLVQDGGGGVSSSCRRHGHGGRRHLHGRSCDGAILPVVLSGMLLFLSCFCFQSARAEVIMLDLMLQPTPTSIHYTSFYLRGPGTMDLSKVMFESMGGGMGRLKNKTKTKGITNSTKTEEGDDDWTDDDDFNDDKDDDQVADDDDNDLDDKEGADLDDGEAAMHDNPTAGDGGDDANDNGTKKRHQHRRLHRQSRRHLARQSYTTVDVVAFHEPNACSKSRSGCDWTTLGVGAKHDAELRWCCTAEAQTLGLCESTAHGRLIVDNSKFKGDKHVLQIEDGDYAYLTDSPKVKELETGKYVLIMASCSDAGRQILVTGPAAVQSVHGYLPGELYGFLFFYLILTVLYFVLVVGYGASMIHNEESRIPIEKWILMTIGLGSLEMLFKLGNVYVWNADGYQAQWIALVGVICGVMKRGWSRCLMVMVSLGWGVTTDSLGRKLKYLVLAGLVYVGVSATRDIMLIVAVDELQVLSENVERGIFDLYTILTFVVAALDVLFAMWILDSLSMTMEYLSSLKQSRKLRRYLALRCLFLFAVLFAMVWVIFAVINSVTNGIVEEEDAWIVDGATEVNYLIVLMGVAWLWRPNPSAREYAYAMELPSSGNMTRGGSGDDDDDDYTGVTELELTGVVPSAVDSDDGDDDYVDHDESHDAITPPSALARNGSRNGGFRD